MVHSLPHMGLSVVALLALAASAGAVQPDLSAYRRASGQVLGAVREVLPAFAGAAEAIAANRTTQHGEGGPHALLALEWTATLQLTRVARIMPAVLEAAGEISDLGATKDGVADAAEALASAADSMQTLLLEDIPKIVSSMADYLGEPSLLIGNATAAAAQGGGEAEAVLEALKTLAAVVPEFFQERLACVSDVAAVLLNLVKTAEEISYTSVDCRGAEMDALACAGDVATSLRSLAAASEEIAAVIFDCGRVNTGCSQLLANSLSAFARTSGATLAATADCGAGEIEGVAPPAGPVAASSCTVDVLEAIYGVTTAVNSVNWLLETCAVEPRPRAQLEQVVSTLETRLEGVLPDFMTPANGEGEHRRLAPARQNGSSAEEPSRNGTAWNATGAAPAPLSSAAAEGEGPASAEGGEGDRQLASGGGCRGVNAICWVSQQCCSTRCSPMHRCRPF